MTYIFNEITVIVLRIVVAFQTLKKLQKQLFGTGNIQRQDLLDLSPGVKLQILLLCFHTFLTEVVGRSY